MNETIHVKGLAEIQAFLDQLPDKIERNILRGALRSGMKVVQPWVAQRIHSVSGELAAGLRLTTRARDGRVTASIKTTGPHGGLAKFIEFGTKAHFIDAPPGGGLRMPGGEVVAGVLHPGSLPYPFMRPALDAEAQNAVIAAAEYMKDRLSTREGIDASGVTIEGDE